MDEKKTEVSIKVSAPYDADSCEGVLAICSWIKEAVCKCGIEIKSEEYSFACRVVGTVTFQQVDDTPRTEAAADSHNQNLQSVNSRSKKFHIHFLHLIKD